jgi:hypothetical protein
LTAKDAPYGPKASGTAFYVKTITPSDYTPINPEMPIMTESNPKPNPEPNIPVTPEEHAELQAMFSLLKPSGTPMPKRRIHQLTLDPAYTVDLIALWEAKVAPLFDSQRQILTPPNADDITLFQGGYGCGKTFTAVLFALHHGLMQPGSTGLMVSTSQLALSDVIFAMVKQIFNALAMTEGQDYVLRQGNKRILLKNGSVIYCRTRRQALMHADYAACDGVEHFSQTQFGLVLAQLTTKPVKLLATMLPKKPTKTTRWHAEVFNTTPHVRQFVVKTAENGYLPPHYVPMLQGALPKTYWPMLLDGQPWPETGLKAEKTPKPAHTQPDPTTHTAVWVAPPVADEPAKPAKLSGLFRHKYWS